MPNRRTPSPSPSPGYFETDAVPSGCWTVFAIVRSAYSGLATIVDVLNHESDNGDGEAAQQSASRYEALEVILSEDDEHGNEARRNFENVLKVEATSMNPNVFAMASAAIEIMKFDEAHQGKQSDHEAWLYPEHVDIFEEISNAASSSSPWSSPSSNDHAEDSLYDEQTTHRILTMTEMSLSKLLNHGQSTHQSSLKMTPEAKLGLDKLLNTTVAVPLSSSPSPSPSPSSWFHRRLGMNHVKTIWKVMDGLMLAVSQLHHADKTYAFDHCFH